PSWLVDKSSIATKIRCASGAIERVISESNPTIACPNCQHVIDNNSVTQEWPGLPIGVKFDPSDQEIISHLLTKVGEGNSKPHPFIDGFIPTIDMDEGICYTHPRYLPGVSFDESASHYFHRAVKAYNSGSRKRRKIYGQDDSCDVRWHKTGKTKPILLNGVHRGSKKVMVLYTTPESKDLSGKTNWIMHQYHLGTKENEKHGEYVASKVFYQQPEHVKLRGKGTQDDLQTAEKVSPVTPSSATREPSWIKKQRLDIDQARESHHSPETPPLNLNELESLLFDSRDDNDERTNIDLSMLTTPVNEGIDNIDLSQNLLDPQQLAEAFPLFTGSIQSQFPNKDGENGQHNEQHSLSISAHLGPDQSNDDIEEWLNLDRDIAKKNDIEDHQNLDLNIAKTNDIEDYQNFDLGIAKENNIEDYLNLDLDIAKKNDIEDYQNLDCDAPTTDFRLSQLDFISQDSYIAWGGNKTME
ncbi:hypothetical protein KIW84_064850, partial [Lathyrus oleraceus]